MSDQQFHTDTTQGSNEKGQVAPQQAGQVKASPSVIKQQQQQQQQTAAQSSNAAASEQNAIVVHSQSPTLSTPLMPAADNQQQQQFQPGVYGQPQQQQHFASDQFVPANLVQQQQQMQMQMQPPQQMPMQQPPMQYQPYPPPYPYGGYPATHQQFYPGYYPPHPQYAMQHQPQQQAYQSSAGQSMSSNSQYGSVPRQSPQSHAFKYEAGMTPSGSIQSTTPVSMKTSGIGQPDQPDSANTAMLTAFKHAPSGISTGDTTDNFQVSEVNCQAGNAMQVKSQLEMLVRKSNRVVKITQHRSQHMASAEATRSAHAKLKSWFLGQNGYFHKLSSRADEFKQATNNLVAFSSTMHREPHNSISSMSGLYAPLNKRQEMQEMLREFALCDLLDFTSDQNLFKFADQDTLGVSHPRHSVLHQHGEIGLSYQTLGGATLLIVFPNGTRGSQSRDEPHNLDIDICSIRQAQRLGAQFATPQETNGMGLRRYQSISQDTSGEVLHVSLSDTDFVFIPQNYTWQAQSRKSCVVVQIPLYNVEHPVSVECMDQVMNMRPSTHTLPYDSAFFRCLQHNRWLKLRTIPAGVRARHVHLSNTTLEEHYLAGLQEFLAHEQLVEISTQAKNSQKVFTINSKLALRGPCPLQCSKCTLYIESIYKRVTQKDGAGSEEFVHPNCASQRGNGKARVVIREQEGIASKLSQLYCSGNKDPLSSLMTTQQEATANEGLDVAYIRTVQGLHNLDSRRCGPNAVAQALASMADTVTGTSASAQVLADVIRYIRNESMNASGETVANNYLDECLGEDFKNRLCDVPEVMKKLSPLLEKQIVRVQDKCKQCGQVSRRRTSVIEPNIGAFGQDLRDLCKANSELVKIKSLLEMRVFDVKGKAHMTTAECEHCHQFCEQERSTELDPQQTSTQNVFAVDLTNTASKDVPLQIPRIFKRNFDQHSTGPNGQQRESVRAIYRLRAIVLVRKAADDKSTAHFATASVEPYGFQLRNDMSISEVDSLRDIVDESQERLWTPIMLFYQQEQGMNQSTYSDASLDCINWKQERMLASNRHMQVPTDSGPKELYDITVSNNLGGQPPASKKRVKRASSNRVSGQGPMKTSSSIPETASFARVDPNAPQTRYCWHCLSTAESMQLNEQDVRDQFLIDCWHCNDISASQHSSICGVCLVGIVRLMHDHDVGRMADQPQFQCPCCRKSLLDDLVAGSKRSNVLKDYVDKLRLQVQLINHRDQNLNRQQGYAGECAVLIEQWSEALWCSNDRRFTEKTFAVPIALADLHRLPREPALPSDYLAGAVGRGTCSIAYIVGGRQQIQAVCYSCEFELRPGHVCVELACGHLQHAKCLYSAWRANDGTRAVCRQCRADVSHPFIVRYDLAKAAPATGTERAFDYVSTFTVHSEMFKPRMQQIRFADRHYVREDEKRFASVKWRIQRQQQPASQQARTSNPSSKPLPPQTQPQDEEQPSQPQQIQPLQPQPQPDQKQQQPERASSIDKLASGLQINSTADAQQPAAKPIHGSGAERQPLSSQAGEAQVANLIGNEDSRAGADQSADVLPPFQQPDTEEEDQDMQEEQKQHDPQQLDPQQQQQANTDPGSHQSFLDPSAITAPDAKAAQYDARGIMTSSHLNQPDTPQ